MPKLVVLIVEDEPILRMDAVDFIEEAGFEAIEAAHADEAIAILKARHDIAVVFTDIEMPGTTDGIRLAHAVRAAGRRSPSSLQAAAWFQPRTNSRPRSATSVSPIERKTWSPP